MLKYCFVIMLICLGPVQALAEISVTEAASRLKAGQAKFIDVRPESEFSKAWIPGSLNMPAPFIKTNSWLKAQKIILVNNGFAQTHLEKISAELNSRGFKSQVMTGGLVAWQQHKLRVAGDFFSLQEARLVTPRDLALEQGNFQVINKAQTYKHEAAVAFASDDSDQASKTRTVVVTDGPVDFSGFKQYQGQGSGPVFFIKGGFSAFQQYSKNHQASIKPRAARLKSQGDCQTCPK